MNKSSAYLVTSSSKLAAEALLYMLRLRIHDNEVNLRSRHTKERELLMN